MFIFSFLLTDGSYQAEMDASDKIESDIRSVLKAFEHFHSLHESDDACKDVTKEGIKDFFKLAIFIEKAVSDFQMKNCAEKFLSVLNWYEEDSLRTRVYSIDFYSRACDHVLSKFFKQNSLKPDIIDVAVRMYAALLPKERLECMLTDFIVKSVSCKVVLDYAVSNQSIIDKNELQSHVLLNTWANQLEIGKTSEVQESIQNMLTVYKMQSSLPLLIKILVKDHTTTNENEIKRIILDVLLKKMMDRSILSKTFWLSVFKDVNKLDLGKLCEMHQEFLLQLSRFVVYLGSMMVKSENVWKGDPKLSICPEITYDEMVMLLRDLKNYSEAHKKYLYRMFKEASANTHLPIWEEFEKHCIREFL